MINFEKYFDTILYLKEMGILTNKEKDDLVVDKRKCPKLSFDKENEILRLYYPSLNHNEFGQQTFEFDYQIFNSAFQEAKFQHFTSKNDYLDFDSLFFIKYYPKANNCVKFIFEFFDITPTNVSKAIHQNKKMSRKISLSPRKGKTLKIIFGLKKNRLESKFGGKNEKIRVDEEEECRINENMRLATLKAAQNYDMRYFDDYREAYVELRKLYKKNPYLSKKQLTHLVEKFQENVDKIQKNMV